MDTTVSVALSNRRTIQIENKDTNSILVFVNWKTIIREAEKEF